MTNSQDYYLTELILAIQNEIQSAVDYISEMAASEGTELGKSTAVMHIENLRVKLPFNVELEQKKSSARSEWQDLTRDELKKNLSTRKGFMVDVGSKGKMATYSKLKILSLDDNGDGDAETARGEIEIVFTPLRRE